MKARIGEAFDKKTKATLYQLQFKLQISRTYNAYSYDMFKTKKEAKEALQKHENGEREYFCTGGVLNIKTTVKGNKVTEKKRVVCYIMSADYDLDNSIKWWNEHNK